MKHLTPAAPFALLLFCLNAQALELTDQPGVSATAGSCYLGCGHAQYDSSNVLDGDYGGSGNTGLNSWNSGFYGGWVQVDLTSVYALDRIELYGGTNYYNPFSLAVSSDGTHWSGVASGGYQFDARLSHTGLGGQKYGAVFDVADNTLAAGVSGRYVRYTVGSGSPHWGHLFEIDVQGHALAAPVPEPETCALMLSGLALLGWQGRRARFTRRSARPGATAGSAAAPARTAA
jgi:hypothetical protein